MKNSLPEFRAPYIDPNGHDSFTARSEFADGLSFSTSHWRQFGLVQLVINTGQRTDHHHCLKTINPEVGSGSAPAAPNSADRINTPAWLEPATFSFQGHFGLPGLLRARSKKSEIPN